MVELGLIGAGVWGRNYIRTIKQIPEAHLKYVVAKTEETLRKLSGDFRKTTDYRDLLNDPELAGVIIATPPSTHYQIAGPFLERGQNLLIEKPLTTNLSEALSLQTNPPTKSKILVGHTTLYSPAYLKMMEILPQLGAINYIRFEGMNWGPFRKDYSALWDWGSHGVAHCLDITKNLPTQVAAWTVDKTSPNQGLEDMAIIHLIFPEGVLAFIEVGWLSPVKKKVLTIVGEQGAAVFDDLKEPKLTIFRGKAGSNLVAENPEYLPDLSLTTEVINFIRAIQSNQVPKSDLKMGTEVVKILTLAEKSAKQSGRLLSCN